MKKALSALFTCTVMLYSAISYSETCPTIDKIRSANFQKMYHNLDHWIAQSSREGKWMVTVIISESDEIKNELMALTTIKKRLQLVSLESPEGSNPRNTLCIYTRQSFPFPHGEELMVTAAYMR